MNDLLQNATEDDEVLRQILSKNEELLLEPLEEDDAVMDSDSIYSVGMTREERFRRYEEVMGEREAKAVNRSVLRILTLMKEFVLSHR